MELRLANIKDAGELARAHMASGARQPAGFMFKLGRSFLAEYYRAILTCKGTVILCAEKNNKIIGFISGTLRAEERLPGLKKHRFRLATAAMPAIMKQPALLFQAYAREKSGSAESGNGFIVQSGPHQEYWAWCVPGATGSLQLQLKWLAVMKTLGATHIMCEVDGVNELSENAHKACGARRIAEITTPDGRKRHILRYELVKPTSPKETRAPTGESVHAS
jgi:hypothetical protein